MYWITAIFYSVLFCSNITNPCNTHAHLNLFCQLVTLQTVCWQLVADTPDWRSTYWTGLQSCRCLCVCVCVWLIRLCVGFYKRKMDWLKKKKEKEMYVWARKRENDMLMSAYCMNKRAGNVCMYVWNANVSALSVFLFVCAHELTDDDIQYRTAAHVIIGPRSAYICFDKAVANMHSFKPKLCFIGSYKTVKSSQNKKGTIIIIMLLMIKQNSGSKKMK